MIVEMPVKKNDDKQLHLSSAMIVITCLKGDGFVFGYFYLVRQLLFHLFTRF